MLNILHISDLHRSGIQPVTNINLINSLEEAAERYQLKPDVIVVSGDLIQGTSDPTESAISELNRQYDEASMFLKELANSFLKGNIHRIVIIPGNHDVSWYYSRLSMQPIEHPEDKERRLKSKQRALDTMRRDKYYRWSWRDFDFYKITNIDTYNRRLEAFALFYERFYEGAKVFSLKPEEQSELFDYPDLETTVVAFNTCFENDHLNTIGNINLDCIAAAGRRLRSPAYRDRLRIAVWHHHTAGAPNKTDFMDRKRLEDITTLDISLGLHGHHHKTELFYEHSRLNNEQKMLVVSVGSLCAGHDDIPYGQSREFNYIQVDRIEKRANVRTFRMINPEDNYITWDMPSEHLMNIFIKESKKEHPTDETQLRVMVEPTMLIRAERNIKDQRYSEAMEILELLDFNDDYVRKMLLFCYGELGLYPSIIERFSVPQSDEEIIILAEAYEAEGMREAYNNLMGSDLVIHSEHPSVKALQTKYSRRQ